MHAIAVVVHGFESAPEAPCTRTSNREKNGFQVFGRATNVAVLQMISYPSNKTIMANMDAISVPWTMV